MALSENSLTVNTLRALKIGDYKIFYDNQTLAEATYREIFIEEIYSFESAEEAPFIIDAGSNIGFTTLFFKMKYPKARILCFEPDPYAFKLLSKNVEQNALSDVYLVNAALWTEEGPVIFYGEVDSPGSDSRGNSIIKTWGSQRKTSTQKIVEGTRLSDYIDRPVDFLKLDIEGAEQMVLEELGEKLNFVKALTIEVHETQHDRDRNNLQKIKSILEQYGFSHTSTLFDIQNCLPLEIAEWVCKTRPALSLLCAQKNQGKA